MRKSNKILLFTLVIVFIINLMLLLNFVFLPVHGNNIIKTETKSLPPFDTIITNGIFNLEIIQGDEHSLTVSGESNIIKHINTTVDDNILNLFFTKSVRHSNHINITVTVKDLKKLKIIFAVDVKLTDFYSDSLEVVVEKLALKARTPYLVANGKIDNLSLKCINGAVVDFRELQVQKADISLKGKCEVLINSNIIDAVITGSGILKYYGEPIISRLDVRGDGRVINGELDNKIEYFPADIKF